MRQQRLALPQQQQSALSRAMTQQLVHNGFFRASRNIAAYIAVGGEMNPRALVEEIRHRNKRCYLPVLASPYGHCMMFAPYFRHSNMATNLYGIPEPKTGKRQLRNGRKLDLILVPLVAFDPHGNRLGMGGGYYDRTFAYINRHDKWHKPKLVGLAYEFQKIDAIKSQPWDVKLDAVATEKSIYYF